MLFMFFLEKWLNMQKELIFFKNCLDFWSRIFLVNLKISEEITQNIKVTDTML